MPERKRKLKVNSVLFYLYFIAICWVFLFFNLISSGLLIQINSGEYSEELFMVTAVGVNYGSKGASYPYALGNVGEYDNVKFTLNQIGVFSTVKKEISKSIQSGDEYRIWFNPKLKQHIVGRVSVGVLKYDENYFSKNIYNTLKYLLLALLPTLGLLAFHFYQRHLQLV